MNGDEPVEVVERSEGRGWRRETWRFGGSRGDQILAEAWLAADPDRAVVVGHGAEADRFHPHPAWSGRLWARHGFSIVVADAPCHGERAGPEGQAHRGELAADPGFLAWWLADQRIVVGVVAERFPSAAVGYLGVSMGALFGVHLMAAEPRVRAAVLAAGGCREADRAVAAAAVRVGGRPVLMVQADRDEVFSRDAAFVLYEALGTPEKEIDFLPGTHSVWRRPAVWNRRMLAFFETSLRGPVEAIRRRRS